MANPFKDYLGVGKRTQEAIEDIDSPDIKKTRKPKPKKKYDWEKVRQLVGGEIGYTPEEHMKYRRGDEATPTYTEAVLDRIKRKFKGKK